MRWSLVVVAACWTGPDAAVPAAPISHHERPAPLRLDVTLERTECMGACPAYVVTIHGDGSVAWDGRSAVAITGARAGHVSRHQLTALDRAIDTARFFELDELGHVRSPTACVQTGTGMTCSLRSFSVCSDTSHAIVTVRRGERVNRIDDAHCTDEPTGLAELEDLVDDLANTRRWIGR